MAMRAPIAGLALMSALVGAQAQAQALPLPAADPRACTGFAWSLQREQAWFSAPSLPRMPSGATLPSEMPGAILDLKPLAQADLPFPPSREPNPGTYAGVLRLPAPLMPGPYQVTLSERAWIDVSQDGRTTLPPGARTMQSGCPTLAKSVRFQIGSGPIWVIVSGAQGDSIRVAVAPVE